MMSIDWEKRKKHHDDERTNRGRIHLLTIDDHDRCHGDDEEAERPCNHNNEVTMN